MPYEDVLKYLEKQVKDLKNEEEYLKNLYDRAIQSKNIALAIGCNIKSVSNKIRILLNEDKIKVIHGIIDKKNTKHYILKVEYCADELWKEHNK